MPVLPPSSKNTAKESERISPGVIVEYEHSGKPLLAAVLGEKKGRWLLLNQRAREAELTSDRLYVLPGRVPASCSDTSAKAEFLDKLAAEAEEAAAAVQLEEVWQILQGETAEASTREITELLFGDDSLEHHLTTRRALLADRIYFKRKRIGFEPRQVSTVEELKVQIAVEAEKRRQEEELINALLKRLKDKTAPLPASVEHLEQLAALGTQAAHAKEAVNVVSEVAERGGLTLRGKPDQKALELLVAVHHFTEHENLALHRFKRHTRFSDSVLAEAEERIRGLSAAASQREDLTALTIFSIDSESTKDIDDALSFEKTATGYRIGIHISDAAAIITPDSLLDKLARERATSIYCPDIHVPMLPPMLSQDALSLVEGLPRFALSHEVELDREMQVLRRRIFRSLIVVKHRLNYDEVDRILFEETRSGDASDPDIHDALINLWQITTTLETKRLARGAMHFNRREMSPVIEPDGSIRLEDTTDDNPSRKLVGELMILANETAAGFAAENDIPFIYRSQEPPDTELSTVGLEVPEGPAREYFRRGFIKRSVTGSTPARHAGLGLDIYAQTTSPIRRASDLLNQRQIAAYLTDGRPQYSREKLEELLASLEQGLHEATVIQRESTRYWLLKYLEQEKLRYLNATVIRADGPKPLAEVEILYSLLFFRPGTLPNGNPRPVKPGEQIRLEIQQLDPRRDIITLVEAPDAARN